MPTSPVSSVQSAWPQIVVRDLFAVWVFGISAACTGLAVNQFRDNPLPLVYSPKADRVQAAVAKLQGTATSPAQAQSQTTDSTLPSVAAEVRYLDLQAVREIVAHKKSGMLLDARPEIFHRLGHIPGALSLSREEFESDYAKKRSVLEKDKSQLIVIYCSGSSCEDSQMVADALVKLNYTRIFVFKGGWGDWTAAHLPEEKVQ